MNTFKKTSAVILLLASMGETAFAASPYLGSVLVDNQTSLSYSWVSLGNPHLDPASGSVSGTQQATLKVTMQEAQGVMQFKGDTHYSPNEVINISFPSCHYDAASSVTDKTVNTQMEKITRFEYQCVITIK